MKAILSGGIFDRKKINIDQFDNKISFPRWHCGAYPSKGYQVQNEYILIVIINLGEPVAYYSSYAPEPRNIVDHNSLRGLSDLAGSYPNLPPQRNFCNVLGFPF